jgi:Flp pilus assembly pilin Flp
VKAHSEESNDMLDMRRDARGRLGARAGETLRRAAGWLRRRLDPARALVAHGEAGQSMVEYAVIIALIAVVAMVAVQALGGGITTVFQNLLAKIQGLGR